MDVLAIFGLQFALSLVVFSLMAKWFVVPWLAGRPREEALVPLIVPHAFRHIGMLFLVPGVVAQPLPGAFAEPAAYGDLVAGLLAILALIALRNRWTSAQALVWVFNILGLVDLVYAVSRGTFLQVAPLMGASWYIPTFLVPALLVTHVMIFRQLVRKGP